MTQSSRLVAERRSSAPPIGIKIVSLPVLMALAVLNPPVQVLQVEGMGEEGSAAAEVMHPGGAERASMCRSRERRSLARREWKRCVDEKDFALE